MEPYGAIDPLWGWVGTFYMGLPVVALFVFLMTIGICSLGGPSLHHRKYLLYPLLRVIHAKRIRPFVTMTKAS